MTSQVAVYNLNGIAIASDTIVTSSSESGSKTTGNSEKIYPLGPNHKVVALHYGSTALNDIHHQFQFNEWIRTLGEPFATLEEYVESYVSWSGKTKLHSPESELVEIRYMLRDHFSEVEKRAQNDFNELDPDDTMTQEEFNLAAVEKLIFRAKDGLAHLKALEKMTGATEQLTRTWLKAKQFDVDALLDEVFANYPLHPDARKILKQSAPYVLARAQAMPWDSFIAFVGYGSEDAFGASIVVTCRSLIEGFMLHQAGEKTQVGPGSQQSEISRFAQSDAIESFIKGYNSDMLWGILWAVQNKGREVVGDHVSSEDLEAVANAAREYIENYSWRVSVQPLLRQVATMNLHGMAELSRTLVGLQATSSEAKDGPVSVGGLVEVVTIDRIHGVQWKTRLPR